MVNAMKDQSASGIEAISTDRAPAPSGHYTQAVAWRDLVFVSGQLAAKPDGAHAADAPFEAQARQALQHVLTVLAAAGCGPEQVLKVTAFIVGIAHWPAFDRVCAETFGETRPARSVVPVANLHHGYLIEIEAIAARPCRSDDRRSRRTRRGGPI